MRSSTANGLEAFVLRRRGLAVFIEAPADGDTIITQVQQSSPSGATINAIWGFDESNAYASGEDAKLLRFDGSAWAAVAQLVNARKYAIWGTAPDDVWVAGWCWDVHNYDGQNVSRSDCLGSHHPPALGMWGTDNTNILVVGVSGQFFQYDGGPGSIRENWTEHPSGVSVDLRDIWGTSATNVYAVGEAGVVIRYDGTQWTQQPGISPRQSLNAIWGSSPTDIFAVGDFGMVLHYDGTSWSSQESGTAEHLFGVGGCDASNVYAVGLHGTILRYDGIKWHPEGSGTTVSLLDVWGDIAAMWAVGDHGTILQKTNPCPPIPTPIPGVSPLGLGVLAGLVAAAFAYVSLGRRAVGYRFTPLTLFH